MHHPPLAQALHHYDSHGRHRFHVPAHAGHGERLGASSLLSDPYRYDLTELDGLDVLSDPEGCLADSQASIATIFKVAHSFLLVNGATVGIEAALLASLKPGDKVLLPRNVHRSVVSGLVLTGAQPIWFLPERLSQWGLWGGVSVESIESELEKQPDIKALIITSPTYEGIGSDIESIATLCRERNDLLIADEAHGSLWPLSDRLPQSAVHTLADCVIHSIHKSAGCLTQGALAHLPHHSRISSASYQQALNLLQTTSPSYLLMASIEACCHFWHSKEGQERFNTWLNQVLELRDQVPSLLKTLSLFKGDNPQQAKLCDPSKLYWIHPQIQGDDWGAVFEEELKLAYESASPYGVLYLMSPGLEGDDFKIFADLIQEGETRLEAAESDTISCQEALEKQNPSVLIPELALSPRDAFFSESEHVETQQACGRIAHEMIVRCPPGIPILMPGERISEAHVPFLPEQGLRVVR
jgi:arginine/lysine/ornithine decarboxylase